MENASLKRVLFRTHKRDFIITTCMMTIWMVFFLLTPLYFLRQLTLYTGPSNKYSLGVGVVLALGMAVSDSLRSITAHQYWQLAQNLGTRVRGTIYAVVYRKAIELRDLSGYTVGELSNLCANDGQRFYDACSDSFFLYASVIMTIVVMITTSLMIGPFALVGCGVYLMFIPLQVRG